MRNLWRAVIYQAMIDHKKGEDVNYLKLDNPDFLMVCDLAGVNPAKIIERLYSLKLKKGQVVLC